MSTTEIYAATTCPEPGVYENVPHEEYHSWNAINASGLKNIARSPAYYKHEREHPTPPTDAMILGTAQHAALMEPDKFKKIYVPVAGGSGLTKRKVEAEKRGQVALKDSDYQAVLDIVEAMKRHETAWGLIKAPENKIELSCVVDMAAPSGAVVRCRWRPDIVDPVEGLLIDLKSSAAAHRDTFPGQAQRYGYHTSAAFYWDCCDALAAYDEEKYGWMRQIYAYLFIVWEKTPPHEPILYRATERFMDAGRMEYRTLLDIYARCLTKNEWPAYPLGDVPLDLPEWYYRQKERGY